MLFSPGLVWRNELEDCPEVQLQAKILQHLPHSTRHVVFVFNFSRISYGYRSNYFSAMNWTALPRMIETGQLPHLHRVDFAALCPGLVLPNNKDLAEHVVPDLHPFHVKPC